MSNIQNPEDSNGSPFKKKARYSDESNEQQQVNVNTTFPVNSNPNVEDGKTISGLSFLLSDEESSAGSSSSLQQHQNETVSTNLTQMRSSKYANANIDQVDKQRGRISSIPGSHRNQTALVKPTFHQKYKIKDIGKPLGEGGFSKVYECKIRPTAYAVKVVEKAKLSPKDDDALQNEISVLNSLTKHPNIIKLYEVLDEPEHYYLITELVEGGELFDRIVARKSYSEREARDVCKILFEAVSYCHSKNIAHRDLKPENLLLVSRANDRDIKIADFGFAKQVTSEQCLLTKCGTPGYVAPEILSSKPYGTKVDMWSLGVIAYTLLGGYLPFDAQNNSKLFEKIKIAQYEFHPEFWGHVSEYAKDLISQLLTVDPSKRISAHEALKSSWICGVDSQLENIDLGNNLQQFRRFNAKRKLRQAILTLIATNKLTSWGYRLRKNQSTITSPSMRNLNI